MDLASTPAMAPPDGQTSQFHAPYNSLQIGTFVAFGITYFLATFFLGLRYFQAAKLVKKVELDLSILTVSYGVALVYFVTMVNLMNHGWGKHLWDVSLADLVEFNKGLLPNTLAYLITPSITKMAMLSVLYCLNPSAIYRTVVLGIGVAIFAYTLTLTSITGGPCNPLKSGTTTCLENVALAQAILNIVSDLAVVATPIPMIHGLHFSTKQKVSVGCILAVGSGVVICSIARLPYVLELDNTTDVTYTEAILGVWTIVEVNLGIICGCVMRLKPLMTTYLPRVGIFSSTDKSKGQRSYQLHSVQKESGDPGFDRLNNQAHSPYKGDLEGKGRDGGSTERILD